jgi:hypothetical protein
MVGDGDRNASRAGAGAGAVQMNNIYLFTCSLEVRRGILNLLEKWTLISSRTATANSALIHLTNQTHTNFLLP